MRAVAATGKQCPQGILAKRQSKGHADLQLDHVQQKARNFLPGAYSCLPKNTQIKGYKRSNNPEAGPGMYERPGPDLWLLDEVQASEQRWTEPCVYFATLAVCPHPASLRNTKHVTTAG